MPTTVSRAFRYALFPNEEQKHQIAVTCGCCRYVYNHFLALRDYEFNRDRGYREVLRRNRKGKPAKNPDGTFIYDQVPFEADPAKEAELAMVPMRESGKYKGRPNFSPMKTSKVMTHLLRTTLDEDGHAFLMDADTVALRNAYRHLDAGYNRFYKALSERKKGEAASVGKPCFKHKPKVDEEGNVHGRDSYVTRGMPWIDIDWETKRVKLPKLGWVKFDAHTEFHDHVVSTAVSRNSDGSYSVSFTCEESAYEPSCAPAEEVGVAFGVERRLAVSNGTVYPNEKNLVASQKKLERLQRRLSRKKGSVRGQKKSKGFYHVSRQIAKLQAHIANQRRAQAHAIANDVVANAGVIHMSAPKVQKTQQDAKKKNLKTADGKLSKQIADTGSYQLYQMIRYKADWNDRVVIEPTETEAWRRTCPVCGHVNEERPTKGGYRTFTCEDCGHTEDVDVMAAKNILNAAGETIASATAEGAEKREKRRKNAAAAQERRRAEKGAAEQETTEKAADKKRAAKKVAA